MSAAIEIEDLHRRYGDTVAVDGVDLRVGEGEIVGILGRNGAGKTTTVETVAGLRRPDRGRVRVLGLDPQQDRAAVRQVLGVQLQACMLHPALRVGELIRLYRSFYRRGADPGELLEAVGLEDRRRTAFEDLSGGQQQRLSIALALIGRPRVAILDELTTGLDPEARRGMWGVVERVRAEGVTVVLVSHAMDEVERLCDRAVILDRGRVVAEGAPTALIAAASSSAEVRFETDAPFDPAALEALPEVHGVTVDGREVVVRGEGDLLGLVSRTLVRTGVVTTGTRSRTPSLEDAYLELTGHHRADTPTGSTSSTHRGGQR